MSRWLPLVALVLFLSASPFEEGGNAVLHQQVYESDHWRVFVDYAPDLPGHLLIVPKRRVNDRYELTREEHSDLYDVEQAVHQALQRHIGDGTHDLQYEKNGYKAGTSVHGHFHIHVYPMPQRLSRWQVGRLLFRLFFFPNSPLPKEELEVQVERYRAAFEPLIVPKSQISGDEQ